MPTFIITASYTDDAIKGFMGGATGRRAAVAAIVEKAGGTLKDLYMTTGAKDVMAIVDMPDGADALAVNMVIGAAGGATDFQTVRAWTPEEFEGIAGKAAAIAASYTPPGG